jgi:hypothetical protein
VEYGSITSIQFNPVNSSELIVGFLSTSPMAFSIISSVYFKKMNDIQPQSSQNAKIAQYMPDGVRFYSFDYLNGVGLWPGLNNVLYYKENFLFYDAQVNSIGTRLIGYVWQTINVVDITLTCTSPDPNSNTIC